MYHLAFVEGDELEGVDVLEVENAPCEGSGDETIPC